MSEARKIELLEEISARLKAAGYTIPSISPSISPSTSPSISPSS